MLIFLTPHLGINWSLRSCSASLYLNIFFGKQALHHKHFLKMAMYKYIIRYDNSKGAHWKFYVLTIHISGARSARAVKLYTYQKWCNNNNNPSRRGNRSVILEKWLLDIVEKLSNEIFVYWLMDGMPKLITHPQTVSKEESALDTFDWPKLASNYTPQIAEVYGSLTEVRGL